jgi:hypothetical protein
LHTQRNLVAGLCHARALGGRPSIGSKSAVLHSRIVSAERASARQCGTSSSAAMAPHRVSALLRLPPPFDLPLGLHLVQPLGDPLAGSPKAAAICSWLSCPPCWESRASTCPTNSSRVFRWASLKPFSWASPTHRRRMTRATPISSTTQAAASSTQPQAGRAGAKKKCPPLQNILLSFTFRSSIG